MIFDVLTIVAQLLNFLVLVWLMKRFLYKPVLHAIDEREKGIAAKLEDAAKQDAQAKQERLVLQEKHDKFDGERQTLLHEAIAAAEDERQRLTEEARLANSAQAKTHSEALLREAQTLRKGLGELAQSELVALSRQVLGDLADTPLEVAMVNALVRRLKALGNQDRQELSDSLATGTAPVQVRSRFPLAEDLRDSLKTEIAQELGPQSPVTFEQRSDLVCGIELVAGGHKVAWSFDGYVARLEHEVALAVAKALPDAP